MKIFLFSKNRFVIRHWQEALRTYQLALVSEYDALFQFPKQTGVAPILLCDFAQIDKNLSEQLPKIRKLYSPIILDCEASFKHGKYVLSAGALGYGNAMMHSVHLHSAIATASEGKVWLYPDFISELIMEVNQKKDSPIEDNPHLDKLSEREREVAILVKQGLNNKEISEKLDITVRTVKAHTGKIYEKLGVKDRLSLVVLL